MSVWASASLVVVAFCGTQTANSAAAGDYVNDFGLLVNPLPLVGDHLGIAGAMGEFGGRSRKKMVTGHSLGGTIAATQAGHMSDVVIHVFNAGTSLWQRLGFGGFDSCLVLGKGRHYHHIARDLISAGIIDGFEDHTYHKIGNNGAHDIANFVPAGYRNPAVEYVRLVNIKFRTLALCNGDEDGVGDRQVMVGAIDENDRKCHWRLERQDDGTYKFFNRHLSMPLYPGEFPDEHGDRMGRTKHIRKYNKAKNAQWRLVPLGTGAYKILNVRHGGPLYAAVHPNGRGHHHAWVKASV